MSITIDSEYIILNVVYPYEISLREIETPKDLKSWAEHLKEKNWMNPLLEQEFIKTVNLYRKWD